MRASSELKYDLEISKSLGDIIDVLKTSALMQFRSFQLKTKPEERFLAEATDAMSMLVHGNVSTPYLVEREDLPSAIVVVTSDEGFLGEMNMLLINMCLDLRKRKEDELIVLGERGARYLEEADQDFVLFPGISDDVSYKDAQKVSGYIIQNYRKRYGKLLIVYPEFISLTMQRSTATRLLPYKLPPGQGAPSFVPEEMLIEPSPSSVLEGLVELWVSFTLLKIFWLSKQSEFGARIMHLEGSTQELSHLEQQLSNEYFKQMHMLKDKVIREISASKALLEKKRGT